MITVFGAGAIGLVLAARLARAGHAVRLCTRSDDDAQLLATHGIDVEEPAAGVRWNARVTAFAGPPADERDVIFACVRGPDSHAAAEAIAASSPQALLVNVQNGLDGDAIFAAHCARVVGAVIRHNCTRVSTTFARAQSSARIILGTPPTTRASTIPRSELTHDPRRSAAPRYAGPARSSAPPFPRNEPTASGEIHELLPRSEPTASGEIHALAELLRSAGYDTGVSARITDDRWLKLCVNLLSTPHALVRSTEHETRAFREGKARLLEEARDVLAAAGIAARSCDGRDRSLDAEIAFQRETPGVVARKLPLYNSCWQGLTRGAPLETDAYHRRIIALGVRHGVATPDNDSLLAGLERVVRGRLGPECLGAAELLGLQR